MYNYAYKCLFAFFSGLSPFLDDSDDETTRNVLRCDYSFPAEHFSGVSDSVKDVIRRLLAVNPSQRASAVTCLGSPWAQRSRTFTSQISSVHLCTLVRRRMKKLNSVAPLPSSLKTTPTRPDSVYSKQVQA